MVDNNQYVTGTLIKKKYYPSEYDEEKEQWDDASYSVTYEYTVNGKKYKKHVTFDEDDTIYDSPKIYYVKSHPKKCYIEGTIGRKISQKMTLSCFCTLLIWAAFMYITIGVIGGFFR